MKRINLIKLIPLAIIGAIIGNFLHQTDTHAYWKETKSGDKITQCFAIQYKLEVTDTQKTKVIVTLDEKKQVRKWIFSTDMVCAEVNADGTIKKTMTKRSRQKETRKIVNQVTLSTDSLSANLKVCDKFKLMMCWDWADPLMYSKQQHKTLRAIAEKATNDAPAKITTYVAQLSGQTNADGVYATKMPLDDNMNGEDAYNEATEETEALNGGDRKACRKQAGKLGWVICPIMDGLSDRLGTIYDQVVEPFLVLDPGLFTDQGVYSAWSVFRDFANIAFVILFLVVIFSQLTGVGIDNYGIKKMMPKLIVAAIMINLSYVACQLAIDLSNILGNGLNSLFSGIAAQIDANANSPTEYFSGTVATTAAFIGLTTATGTAFITGVTVLTMGWAIIIPLLSGLISAGIAVLFMFVVLFVRKAIAILLVAVAPVAVVTYIMPNTKRAIFDKWLNIFKGILLVYPLAGALVGGGLLASAIIVSSLGGAAATEGEAGLGTFFMYLGALVLQVIPFFFLPALFRRSLSALGNVGERLGNTGRRLGSGASRRFRENEGVQMAQARWAAGRQGGLRERIASRMPGALGKNGMARNRARYQRMLGEQGSLDAMYGEDYLLATQTSNEMKALQASGDINNNEALRQGLRAAIKSNDRAKINAYSDALSAKGENGRDDVKNIYNDNASTMSKVAAETLASNIMANHAADYKNNNRDFFNVMNGINNNDIQRGANGYTTTRDHADANRNDLQQSARAENMAGMDNSSFAATFMGGQDNYKSGTVSLSGLNDSQKRAVGENAYNALKNSTNMKADRVERLNAIVKESGYTPPPQEVRITP